MSSLPPLASSSLLSLPRLPEECRLTLEESQHLRNQLDEIRSLLDGDELIDSKKAHEILSYVEKIKSSGWKWDLFDPNIVFKAGQIYEAGEFVPQNIKQAYEYYKIVTDKGNHLFQHADAQYHCALILETGGDGVSQDKKTAIELYIRAAVQGHFLAQLKMVPFIQNKVWEPDENFSKKSPLHNIDRWLELAQILNKGEEGDIKQHCEILKTLQRLMFCGDQNRGGWGTNLVSNTANTANRKFFFHWLTPLVKNHLNTTRKEHGEILIEIGRLVKHFTHYPIYTGGSPLWLRYYQKAVALDATGNLSPLFWVIQEPDAHYQLPYLLEKKPNLNQLVDLNDEYYSKHEGLVFTPLMFAMVKDNFQCVRLLLEAGLDINLASDKGHTAFHHIRGVSYIPHLFWYGADPDVRDKMNNTIHDVITCDVYDAEDINGVPILRNMDELRPSIFYQPNDLTLHNMVEWRSVPKPIFNLGYFQLLSDYIETQYLKEFKEDHLLITNRGRLETLISEIVDQNLKPLLELYEKEIALMSIDNETEEVAECLCKMYKKDIIHTFKECLKQFFLYPRQEELFWQPYVELFINADRGKDQTLSFKFPRGLQKLIIDYYLPYRYKVLGFAKETQSPFSTPQGLLCEQTLIENRVTWLFSHLKKMHFSTLECENALSSSGDKKMALDLVPESSQIPMDTSSDLPLQISWGSPLVVAYDLMQSNVTRSESSSQGGEPSLKRRRLEPKI